MEQESESSDVDDIVSTIEARVADRRRQGVYPPELAETLDAHFRRVAAHRSSLDLEELRKQVEALDALCAFEPTRIPVESRVPGGSRLHALVARLTARQTQGILEQVQQFADGTRVVLRSVLAALEEPHGHVHADIIGMLDAVFEQLAAFERGPAGSAEAVADLRRRMEALEAAERARTVRPFFSWARFDDELGARPERCARVAERLRGCAPVVELGSGRGLLLDALAGAGIEARGFDADADAEAIEACRRRGLVVEQGDLLVLLQGVGDAELGGIALVGTLERMTPQQVIELALLAHDKLRPGGRLVVDALDPGSFADHADRIFLDPRTTRPVSPAYLAFLLGEAGFTGVEVERNVEYSLVATR